MAEGASDTPEERNRNWMKEWDQGFWDVVYSQPGQMLARHFEKVTEGRKGLNILVPLSATTYDLIWLCDLGHTVVGTDLAELAAQRIFKQYKQTPVIEDVPSINGKLYKNSSGTFKYYIGDFFHFSEQLEGKFDFIWDSKAMCALDARDKDKYVKVVRSVMGPKCVLMFEFYKKKGDSQPSHFFIEEDIRGLYGDICDVQFLDEGEFDTSSITWGVIDDAGNVIPQVEPDWKQDSSGEDLDSAEPFDTVCYCLHKRK